MPVLSTTGQTRSTDVARNSCWHFSRFSRCRSLWRARGARCEKKQIDRDQRHRCDDGPVWNHHEFVSLNLSLIDAVKCRISVKANPTESRRQLIFNIFFTFHSHFMEGNLAAAPQTQERQRDEQRRHTDLSHPTM